MQKLTVRIPEESMNLLTRSGTFQDDRLDLPDESIQHRIDAGETLLAVIQALERADGPVETAEDLRWIVVGMEDSDERPPRRSGLPSNCSRTRVLGLLPRMKTDIGAQPTTKTGTVGPISWGYCSGSCRS